MYIIPELKVVVLLTPRTGSGTLRKAIAKRWPEAFMPYRHMEADGVPYGYTHFAKVGVVRNPLDRLFSLYNFIRDGLGDKFPEYQAHQRESAQMPFSEWLVENQTVFTNPYVCGQEYHPLFSVHHPIPETRKSQRLMLRPDLGTHIYRFRDQLDILTEQVLDLKIEAHENCTPKREMPPISLAATAHMKRYFAWDWENC